jgi:diphthamide biosynthesis methyltransferase
MSNIEEQVQSFMDEYTANVAEHGLEKGNAFANERLIELSRDMDEETAAAFTAAARKPLNEFLNTVMESDGE